MAGIIGLIFFLPRNRYYFSVCSIEFESERKCQTKEIKKNEKTIPLWILERLIFFSKPNSTMSRHNLRQGVLNSLFGTSTFDFSLKMFIRLLYLNVLRNNTVGFS